jgi:hypothetical protein
LPGRIIVGPDAQAVIGFDSASAEMRTRIAPPLRTEPSMRWRFCTPRLPLGARHTSFLPLNWNAELRSDNNAQLGNLYAHGAADLFRDAVGEEILRLASPERFERTASRYRNRVQADRHAAFAGGHDPHLLARRAQLLLLQAARTRY